MTLGAPVVIVGAGPAGVHVAQELHRRSPDRAIVLLGAEPCEPYDRVRLSSALAGDVPWPSLNVDASPPVSEQVSARYGTEVVAVERSTRHVCLRGGERLPYASLILATGSRPHVPEIHGVTLPGVFTFRDQADAQRLIARRIRSRRIVVLGGGLLGLEAARAMRRFNTAVTVVEHADRLMARQLDADAAAILRRHVQTMGIEVVIADGAAAILGDSSARAVRLRSGRELSCDTVLIATGIVPNVQLALGAGLAVRRGIRVDDALRTSDPSVYAVGECAEHEGIVYGLAGPCLEQAAVAAAQVAGADARYRGSLNTTRLKIFSTPVFAAGVHPDRATIGLYSEIGYRDGDRRCRKLLVSRGRLAGVLGIGEWRDLPRVLEAVQGRRRVSLLELWRFRRTGELWPDGAAGAVAAWPAQATVCNCTGVTRGQLSQAIAGGCTSLQSLARGTRASTVCGSCAPLLANLLGDPVRAAPAPLWRTLLGSAAIALVAALLLGLLPGLSYLDQWSGAGVHWDRIWRDSIWKQASGYTLLGLSALGLLLTARKRLPAVALAPYWLWRYVHVVIGLTAVAALLVHTGGRLGHGLNAWLGTSFLAVIAAGSAAAGLIALEHRLNPAQAKQMRGRLTWLHILSFWPLPVLLGFHVVKTYYF